MIGLIQRVRCDFDEVFGGVSASSGLRQRVGLPDDFAFLQSIKDPFIPAPDESDGVVVRYVPLPNLCGLYRALAHAISRCYGPLVEMARRQRMLRDVADSEFHLRWDAAHGRA